MGRKIVKPTPSEKAEIDRRMMKKYGPKRIYKEEDKWFPKLKSGIKAYFKKEKKDKKKKHDTTRTSAVEARLRQSGMTEKEIKRLRGK